MAVKKRFFCQECRVEEYTETGVMPYGWISMLLSLGGRDKFKRLGTFCSVDCLAARIPRLRYEVGETDWRPAPEYNYPGEEEEP